MCWGNERLFGLSILHARDNRYRYHSNIVDLRSWSRSVINSLDWTHTGISFIFLLVNL